MSKNMLQMVIIGLLVILIGLLVYGLFFRKKEGADVSKTPSSPGTQQTLTLSENLNVQEISVGILRLENSKEYALSEEQKQKFLLAYDKHMKLQKETKGYAGELEKLLNKEQVNYIKQGGGLMAGPVISFDPSSSITPEHQAVFTALEQLTGKKQTPQTSETPVESSTQEVPNAR